MKPSKATLAAVLPAIALCIQANAEVVETQTLDDSIVIDDSAEFEIVVRNVFGSIRVSGHDEPVVELSAVETVRGDTQTDVDRARSELSLQTISEPGRVAFVVRRSDGGGECGCGRRWDGYRVEYDIELRVPRDVAIDVETVNRGEISVAGVYGRFRASNVNGTVTLVGLRSAGHAETVNGELTASFDRSPAESTSFETVNGEIDVTYPADLSAELRFKTTRGDIWTDFDVAALPATQINATPPGRRNEINADRYAAVRVDDGGPVHSFETLNGDIYVRRSR